MLAMKPESYLSFLLLFPALGKGAPTENDYPIQPIAFTDVRLSDTFWAPRIEANRTVTIPFVFEKNVETGRVDNFAKAAGAKKGSHEGQRYNDSDVYKAMEGAVYSLSSHPDPELEKELDRLIELIAAAQEEDGYLFTGRTIEPDRPIPGIGETRWSNLPVSHELYNVGHLYEAAVAHYRATGKRTFLDLAIKNADLLVRTFGPGNRTGFPGHQEIEIGLAKLYRVTGNNAYLNLAQYFLDQRGRDVRLKRYPPSSRFAIYNDPAQIQAHRPVLEQQEAVGHAVRAAYMYSAMADMAVLLNAAAYKEAIERLWNNVVGKKMYLTGGIGSRHDRERFGEHYELPNRTAYNETCAAIGNVFWNFRMFLLHGDAKYVDVLERTLYNGVISGVSLRGDSFFYANPLESNGKYEFNKGAATRQGWFDVACCPGNIVRFLASVPGYFYARTEDNVYVNLFATGSATISPSLRIRQETDYPWGGKTRIVVEPDEPEAFTLLVRIPGWARGEPVPTDLYRYANDSTDRPSLVINGKPTEIELVKGYARMRRTWAKGDMVELDLPMPIRRVESHPNVGENAGRVALERGPLVYCAEGVDNGGSVLERTVPGVEEVELERREDLLNGIVVMTEQKGSFTAIPYYAWSHRGVGEMAVWLTSSDAR